MEGWRWDEAGLHAAAAPTCARRGQQTAGERGGKEEARVGGCGGEVAVGAAPPGLFAGGARGGEARRGGRRKMAGRSSAPAAVREESIEVRLANSRVCPFFSLVLCPGTYL